MLSRLFHWFQVSIWAPYLVIIALLFGVFGGIVINKGLTDYYQIYNTPQPLTITSIQVTKPTQINKARELLVDLNTPASSFYPGCDRLNSHILIDPVSNSSYPLDTVIAGGNFSNSLRNPHISMNLPNTVPGGDYIYHIRTIYLCNVFPIGLVSYHTETKAEHIHLDDIPNVPLPGQGTSD